MAVILLGRCRETCPRVDSRGHCQGKDKVWRDTGPVSEDAEGGCWGNQEQVRRIRKEAESKKRGGVGSLEKMIPSKYRDRAQKLLSNMPEKQRQEVTEYIGELYRKYGDPRKTMQEHHWIEQSRIRNTEKYPFLGSPPMDEDLLKSKTNLSLIVGHNGGHKKEYNDLLDEKLKGISKDLKLECLKRNISLNELMQDDNMKKLVNDNVKRIITEMQDAVKKDHKIMNNVEKIFILIKY